MLITGAPERKRSNADSFFFISTCCVLRSAQLRGAQLPFTSDRISRYFLSNGFRQQLLKPKSKIK